MVALTLPLLSPAATDMRWVRVEDISAVSACRNIAQTMAARLSFSRQRADEVVLAVSEAASNLHKHASQGTLLLRRGVAAVGGGSAGLELVTIDAGPGLRDVGAAMRDGHSTAGTLGIGLGAIRRLADFCDLYSVPGHGSALVARFWPERGSAEISCAGLTRPIIGEQECGDAFCVTADSGALTVLLCDGLGHGVLAAAAARTAVEVALQDAAARPAELLARVHDRLRPTRGGAVAVVRIAGDTADFAGLGNIAAWILTEQVRTAMLSAPGIAGHQARGIRERRYEVPPGSAIVLHSDGLSSRWNIRSLPGLSGRDPLIVGGALLAEAGLHRDDASIVVVSR